MRSWLKGLTPYELKLFAVTGYFYAVVGALGIIAVAVHVIAKD